MFSKKQIFNILWPLLVEQLLTVLVGMIDVLMVASLGEDAVSGVALVDSLNLLFIQMLFALTAAGTVAAARFFGARDYERLGKTFGQLLFITVSFTAVIMIIMVIGRRAILGFLFGKIEAEVMDNALIYMVYTAISIPFLAGFNSGSAMFRAVGNTRISMLISMFMNGLNIVGNAICIFGLGMGVEGVAIPTLISRASAAVLIFWLYQKKIDYGRIKGLKSFKPDGKIIKSILSIGIPNSIESGIFQFGKVMLQSLVSTLGTPSIAGFAVASNLVTYLYLPGNALGAGTMTIVGQCLGAGEKKQAKGYASKLIILNYMILAVFCTIMILGREFFVGCYNLSGEAAMYAGDLIFAHCVAMVLWPIAFLTPYYFRTIGKATFTMWVAVVTMWLFRIGCAYLFVLVFKMNVLGIWYAMFCDWLVRFAIYIVAFKRAKVE